MTRNPPNKQLEMLLARIRAGDAQAVNRLISLVYTELHRVARRRLKRNSDQSLQTGDLVNEACYRLLKVDHISWNDQRHFFAAVGSAMRTVLIDHARKRNCPKRPNPKLRVDLPEDVIEFFDERTFDILALGEALDKLRTDHPDLAELVDLRFFSGRTHEEVAAMLNIGDRTVRLRWKLARAKLRLLMGLKENGEEHD